MRRSLIKITILYIFGIVMGRFIYLPVIPSFIILFAGLTIYAIVLLRKPKGHSYIFPFIIIFCGIFAVNTSIYLREGNIIEFSGKEILVEGTVVEEPLIKEAEVVYILKTHRAVENNKRYIVNGNIQVKTEFKEGSRIYQYGDHLSVRGTLFLPAGKRNPGGFNYKDYLLARGICGNLYVREYDINFLGKRYSNPLKTVIYKYKEKISGMIKELYPCDEGTVLSGIILGMRGEVSPVIIKAFSDSGIYHILAISGLHVGFIVALLYFISRKVGQRVPALIITTLGIILYTIMVGGRPSVVRAGIMSVITLLGIEFGKERDYLTSLSAAALIILIINPLALFMPGFQLSFGATMGIIISFPKIKGLLRFLPDRIADLTSVTFSAQLGILPLIAYYFGNISLIFVFTNLLVLPLMGLIIVLGFLSISAAFIFLPLGSLIAVFNSFLIKTVINLALFFSSLPFSSVSIPLPSIMLICSYYIAFLSVFLRYKKGFVLGLILTVFVVWFIIIFNDSLLEVTFIDVGQGDAIYIKTPEGRHIMIDSGGLPDYYSGDFDIGRDVILPFLKYKGVKKLDIMIMSHIHDDHIKGMIPVLDEIRVDYFIQAPQKVLSKNYNELLKKITKLNIPVITLKKGDYFKIDDDLFFYVFHPDDIEHKGPGDENNNSLVLKMIYRNISFLFTGDIEKEAEGKILQLGYSLDSTVLKVPHHGSITSSTPSFIKEVNPKYAIISVGRNNAFGHPHEGVIERLEHTGARVYRTDLDGGITIRTDGEGIVVKTTVDR